MTLASGQGGTAIDAKTRTLPRPFLGQGRYELLAALGEGGMASVWRARDTTTGELVAVKILHPEIAERASQRSRFVAEARTMRRLRHPSVVRVGEVGEDDGRPWFTMELAADGTLINRLEAVGKLRPIEALDVMFQVLQGLSVAHAANVVHRDVKPDNVLLSRDGRVRLTDFGIARIRDERVDHLTLTGAAMGTIGYMSPEQRESAKDVGPGADLYATGATLYATVTGCQPPDLFASHLDPTLLDPVPPAIREVVRKATAYRAENRYLSARAMAEDVVRARDAIARGMGLPEKAPEWLERFDRLLAEAAPSAVDPDAARRPSVTSRPPPPPPPPTLPLPTPTPPPALAAPIAVLPARRWAVGAAIVLVIALVVLGAFALG